MDTSIRVSMFGKFTIFGPGLVRPRVISLTGRSKRLWSLVAYLILHRDTGVSAEELIGLFWHENGGQNPMSTLQNNISRARNALEVLGLEDGKRLIYNNSGTYFWAPSRETWLDCEAFQTKARQALACSDREQAMALAKEAAKLYTADFLPENSAEGWCAGLASDYRNQHLTLCRSAAQWMLEAKRWEEAASLCAGVIALEPEAEVFTAMYMRAQTLSGNPEKALARYAQTCTYFREVYGAAPSQQLEAERMEAEKRCSGGIESDQVSSFLKTGNPGGAFQCDNNVFRQIVSRHLRDMHRSGRPAQVLVIQLTGEGLPQEKRSVYMRQMENVILNSLRAGDPFTRKGMEQFLALLPGATDDNGITVAERVFRRFQMDYPFSGAQFAYQVLDLGRMGQAWNNQEEQI